MDVRAFASRLEADARGVAAIEFAIGAPMLILGLLAMIDAGMAAATRMEIDRNVRSGAQAAMSLNNDPAAIRSIVLAAAGEPADLAVDVAMVCACEDVDASCTVPCDSGEAPSVFFNIAAHRPFTGILVDLEISSRTRVQIR
jgi:Flp pilus assembly protein TadG